jgi:hypothetical protein
MRHHLFTAAIAAFLFQLTSAGGQEAGWNYSPIPGEGDRASLGCARDSTEDRFTCIAVRCEDDFTTGVHIHTSRPEGDRGTWLITVDRENKTFEAMKSTAPYGARITTDIPWLLERLKQGTYVYLQPRSGTQPALNPVHLNGSLYAINRALAYCAPRVPPSDAQSEEGQPSIHSPDPR